jgi:hypothetical protein
MLHLESSVFEQNLARRRVHARYLYNEFVARAVSRSATDATSVCTERCRDTLAVANACVKLRFFLGKRGTTLLWRNDMVMRYRLPKLFRPICNLKLEHSASIYTVFVHPCHSPRAFSHRTYLPAPKTQARAPVVM